MTSTLPQFSNDMVAVMVGSGDGAVTFAIERAEALERFEVAAKALNGGWAESEEDKITLPKKDPTTFVNYLRFVFRGTSMVSEQFLTSRKTDDIEKEQDDANPQLRHIKLAKVYGFCEFVGDMRGKDTVLDEMVKATHRPRFDGMTRAPGNEDIRRIYNQTLDNDPARRFLVDLTVDFDGAGWIVNKDREILPVDYVFDVAKSCLDIQGENGKASTSSKTYDSVNYSNV